MRIPSTLIALIAACEPAVGPTRAVLPDDRLLVDPGDEVVALMRVEGESSRYAALTLQVITNTNAGLGAVLGLIDTITAYPATWTDEAQTTLLWGPWTDDGVDGQLWLQAHDDAGYTWAIQLRPEAAGDDAWTAVLAGIIDPGATAITSTGRFWMDFTAIDALGIGDGVTGRLAVDYAIRETGATTTVFAGDIAQGEAIPVDAATRFDHDEGAGGTMDVVVRLDVSQPPNGTEELVLIRSRWQDDRAGRADAYLTGGDLGLLTFTETECWSSAGTVVYRQNNYELVTEGDVSDCAFAEPSFLER